MASLTAISFTMVGGIGVFSVTMGVFGCAMSRRSTFIAARCTSRPKNVIYNPNPKHPCQYRGNPMLGWILWVMRLSYGTMLKGVPGTGTRNGGLSGSLLKVNLDGIVLLRFHHLCLRVCLFAALLYTLVILPVYVTAQCSPLANELYVHSCTNITDYERLTLTNVPPLKVDRTNTFKGIFFEFFLPDHNSMMGRLYAVVICSWLVTFFAMHELEMEWGDVLAMRRVYYLEADHWSDRKQELDEIYTAAANEVEEDPSLRMEREPWVPHPEQRDTVPNVALYSILVGSLPSLPTELADTGDGDNHDALLFSRKQSIDWQLSVTTAFFDHCVPNQPGFSSSVAAVTILPAASQLGEAWNQWYRAAGKLRRLRFIRRQIAEKKQSLTKSGKETDTDDGSGNSHPHGKEYEVDLPPLPPLPPESPSSSSPPREQHPRTPRARNTNRSNKDLLHQVSSHSFDRIHHEVLGSMDDIEVESNLLHALNFGPEQTAVYSREFAQGAGNLAPHGWFEERIKSARLDELIEMEKRAVAQVHEANVALAKAQERIAEDSSEEDVSEDEMAMIMHKASGHGSALVDSDDSSFDYDNNSSTFSFAAESSSSESDSSQDVAAKRPSNKSGRSARGSGTEGSSSPTGEYKITSKAAGLSEETEVERRKQKIEREMKLRAARRKKRRARQRKRQERAARAARKKKPAHSASLPVDYYDNDIAQKGKNFSLPSDLGLEAGLWIEQKNLSQGTAQHTSRGRAPPGRSKSFDGASMFDRTAPGRSKSSDLTAMNRSGVTSRTPRRAPPGRATSDVGTVYGDTSSEQPSSRTSPGAARPSQTAPPRAKTFVATTQVTQISPFQEGGKGRDARHQDRLRRVQELKERAPGSASASDARHQDRLRRVQELSVKAKDGHHGQSGDSSGGSEISEESLKGGSTRASSDYGSNYGSESGLESIDTYDSNDSFDSDEDFSSDISDYKSTEMSTHTKSTNMSANTDKSESFWEKLEEENRRKAKLRAKLVSMQNDEDPSSRGAAKEGAMNSDTNREIPSPRLGSATPGNPEGPAPNYPTLGRSLSYGRASATGADASRTITSPHQMMRRVYRSSVSSPRKEAQDTHGPAEVDWRSVMPQAPGLAAHQSESRRSLLSVPSETIIDENIKRSMYFEAEAGLREDDTLRVDDEGLRHRPNARPSVDKWAKVESIVHENSIARKRKKHKIMTGSWIVTYDELLDFIRHQIDRFWRWASSKKTRVVDDFARDSTYAVVTFTSRQAAVAARHCLADSRGADRWVTVAELPVPPLADAPACNLGSFRGCVRPVTLSINEKQKIIRHQLALAALACIYFFYTIPLVAAQALVHPQRLKRVLPDIEKWQESSVFIANIFSGLIPALIYTGFFAVCPALFKVISNFGSNATSSVVAENSALQYFWWFMVVAAFSGTSFSTAVIEGFNQGIAIGAELQAVIEVVAATIPSQVSATWLNWILVRFTIVLPTQYLLQLNTFLFACMRLKCCSRVVRGGGAGAPVPYRIYVDSGVVMLCVFALAPASPLIAPAAFVYFLFCTPLLRWTMIFLYKPRFDMGGSRFPFIFDMCVSGMVVGQILLVAMMSLKQAAGPALAAALPLVPTIFFRYVVRRRYLRAFTDAALLQTSLLDGWDTNEETSQNKREEFRQFLVDSHKAAYVPVCIASAQTTVITAEPAVVVNLENDEDDLEAGSLFSEQQNASIPAMHHPGETMRGQVPNHHHHQQNQPQPGQMMRRTTIVQNRRGPALDAKQFVDESSSSYLAESAQVYSPNAMQYSSPRLRKSVRSPAGATARPSSGATRGLPPSPKLS